MPGYTDEQLNTVFDRTDGNCHICGKRMAFSNYGAPGRRQAWEVEHSRPRAHGGTDHVNNLYGAHVSCNREKGTLSSRSARARHGRTRAPRSRVEKGRVQRENTVGGAVVGAALGAAMGPGGWILGGLVGAAIGQEIEPDD